MESRRRSEVRDGLFGPHEAASRMSGYPANKIPRVLLIDDNALFLRSLARALRSDFAITTASDPIKGLALVLSTAPPFNVVLCDIGMPGMSGRELYIRVSHERPELLAHFIFLTGGTGTATEDAFLQTVRWLPKPCTVEDLCAGIADVMESTNPQ